MKNKTAKIIVFALAAALLLTALCGCGSKKPKEGAGMLDGEGSEKKPPAEPQTPAEPRQLSKITDEQAVPAVKNYCYISNPDLKGVADAGEYPVYWYVESGDEDKVVVLYRSYTGALVRYYIDRSSGDTYATEFVPGVTPEEERVEGSFDLRQYLVIAPDGQSGITGMWKTASVGYEHNGTLYPDFHVQFTDSDIVYGHLEDGKFAFDHSDRIKSLEKTEAGGFKVQGETAGGVQYTFLTSESDENVLEYYETWDEKEFPDKYRGGASLSRCE